jgi:hypothetical protein
MDQMSGMCSDCSHGVYFEHHGISADVSLIGQQTAGYNTAPTQLIVDCGRLLSCDVSATEHESRDQVFSHENSDSGEGS